MAPPRISCTRWILDLAFVAASGAVVIASTGAACRDWQVGRLDLFAWDAAVAAGFALVGFLNARSL